MTAAAITTVVIAYAVLPRGRRHALGLALVALSFGCAIAGAHPTTFSTYALAVAATVTGVQLTSYAHTEATS